MIIWNTSTNLPLKTKRGTSFLSFYYLNKGDGNMAKCDYGCGRVATTQLKNGKWCCSRSQNSCPSIRSKNSKALAGKPRPWRTGSNCTYADLSAKAAPPFPV